MSVTDFSAILQPVARAKGLPNRHYVSDETFAEERERVLFASWSGLTVAAEIPEPGDAIPVDFVGLPLVAVRGRDGQVRVFQNTCRHRGMILVSKPGKVGNVIRCPYHSWSYALSGELKATPHVGGPGHNTHEEIRRDELGLIEIRSHVWRDVVFVNVSGDAPAFEDDANVAMTRWAEFDQPIYHGGADSTFSFDVKTNWKLAVENFCESYHLPWVHPGLNAYSKLEDHYHIEAPGAFSGQGTRVYAPQITDDGRRFPDFKGLDKKWDKAAEYIAVFPNVLLGVHRDHAFAIVLEPVAKDRTIEHVHLYYSRPEVTAEPMADMRRTNAAMWHEVFEEDISVVEGMQAGRAGLYFDGGKFSPAMDGPTHLFHAWIAEHMAGRPLAAE
ncbi:MAG: aromatic ring-hydroxylating dioxygenase subunit alpha [Pseudomonadota bacterium]